MKTKFTLFALLSILSITTIMAQDRTTVTAQNSEISDNLDLRAVASIFGDSKDLEDFERRLNNPETPISNLDLNNDNQVDYLRVIETVDGRTHIIVIQSVLGRDLYQDIASIEVEKDKNNKVQVQVVGDVYMYGTNYIYEPVYAFTPVIYSSFWISNYRPYYSSWYWGYYPSYYYVWRPFPLFRYRSHIAVHINVHHHYNYVNNRRFLNSYNRYYNSGHRGNYYASQYPDRSFSNRNTSYSNRYEMDKNRSVKTVAQRNEFNNATRTLDTKQNAVRNSSLSNTRSMNDANSRNEISSSRTDRNLSSTRVQSESSNSSSRNSKSAVENSTRVNSSTRNSVSLSENKIQSNSRSNAVENTSRNNSSSRDNSSMSSSRQNSLSSTPTRQGNSGSVSSSRNYSDNKSKSAAPQNSRQSSSNSGNRRG
jgi:hypothetical protein